MLLPGPGPAGPEGLTGPRLILVAGRPFKPYRMNGRMVPPNMAKMTTRIMTNMLTFSLVK